MSSKPTSPWHIREISPGSSFQPVKHCVIPPRTPIQSGSECWQSLQRTGPGRGLARPCRRLRHRAQPSTSTDSEGYTAPPQAYVDFRLTDDLFRRTLYISAPEVGAVCNGLIPLDWRERCLSNDGCNDWCWEQEMTMIRLLSIVGLFAVANTVSAIFTSDEDALFSTHSELV